MRDQHAADYIAFAASMGTATAPLPLANVGRTGSFMKCNAEMIVAWREFGMGNEEVAAQLTLVGLPISAARVKDILPTLASNANRPMVEAIVAQLRIMFRSSRLHLARQAEANLVPTLEMTSAGSRLSSAAVMQSRAPRPESTGMKSAPAAARAAKSPSSRSRLRDGDQSALDVAPKLARADTSTGPTRRTEPNNPARKPVSQTAKSMSPFAAERVAELVPLPGEEEDLSGVLTDGVMVSFGDLRRAAWSDYASPARTHSIALPGGTVLDPPKKLFVPLVRGDYANWGKFIEAVEKS
jgi:hypothetical protein